MKAFFALLIALVSSPPVIAATRVVMISIDGLRPEAYLDPAAHGLQMPNLRALRESGVSARRMIPVFPSVTYPAHTTLVTGTRPAEHGVVSNFTTGQSWVLEAAQIHSQTLWQAAEAAGKTTAIVTWPATYGAQVDYLVPENLSFGVPDVRKLVLDGSTPGLFESLEKDCGPVRIPSFEAPDAGEKLDDVTACFAAQVLRTHRPDLLLVHFLDADHRQHFAGVESREARHAFERIDGFVGQLRRAAEKAGVAKETVFVIVGDHGFLPVHTIVNLNAILLATDFAKLEGGKIAVSRGIRIEALGGSGALYLEKGADAKLAARIESALRAEIDRRYRGLVELVPRAELEAMGAFPGAALGFAAAEGYMLAPIDAPVPMVPSGSLQGMHGYRPELPGMATGFIAAGPGVRRGVEVPLLRQIDVAPTVAALLGVPFEHAVGLVIPGVLESRAAGPGLGLGSSDR
jgi:predicted AlkP superfamily pyrophosphatase or phosphodiesterase